MKIFNVFLLFLNVLLARADLVVLDPAGVEILYMLGAEERILATATLQNSKMYPYDKTEKLPTVGTYSKPSLEKIVALKPKMVILSYHSTGLKEDLEQLGFQSILIKANNLSDIVSNIQMLAKLVDKEQRAREVIGDFNRKLEKIKRDPIIKKGGIFYSSAPLMAFGADTLPGDILKVLGVDNLAAQSVGERPILSQEFVLRTNPEFILYGLALKDVQELYKTNPLLKNTNAFKNGRILPVNASLLLRGSPHIMNEIQSLHEHLKQIFKEK